MFGFCSPVGGVLLFIVHCHFSVPICVYVVTSNTGAKQEVRSH